MKSINRVGLALIVIMSMGLTACPKKDETRSAPPPMNPGPVIPPGGYYPAPTGYGFPLANALGFHMSSTNQPSVQMAVTLFSQMQTQPFMGQPTQAMLAGQILFGPEAGSQFCQVPIGVPIPIQTMQPVTLSNRVLSDFEFQAGPMIIRAYQPQLDDLGGTQIPGPNGQLYNNFLAAELVVQSVNGMPCQGYSGWFTLSRP